MNSVLEGTYIRLEPIEEKHYEALKKADEYDEIWQYNLKYRHQKNRFELWFQDTLEKHRTNKREIFILFDKSSSDAIGTTSYYEVSQKDKKLCIGYTWYLPPVWGSYVNPESKFLLLKEAFENRQCKRVGFHVDERNERSRQAVLRLGASQEGILRKHMALGEDFNRNTVVFSIIDDEWLDVKTNLQKRLEKYHSL